MPARSVCLVTLSPSEAGPGRFGRQASVADIYHTTMPCHAMHQPARPIMGRAQQFSKGLSASLTEFTGRLVHF